MRKQILGWTEPKTPTSGYVQYLMIFHEPKGDLFEVVLRDPDGSEHRLTADRSLIRALMAMEIPDAREMR
jgi:hypothetical protein